MDFCFPALKSPATIIFELNHYLTRQVSQEQILIYNDGQLGNSSLTAWFRGRTTEGFNPATFQLLAQRFNY
jgi:hypothetical protein